MLQGAADFCKEMVIPSPTLGAGAAAHTPARQANAASFFKQTLGAMVIHAKTRRDFPAATLKHARAKTDPQIQPPRAAVTGGSAWPEQPSF